MSDGKYSGLMGTLRNMDGVTKLQGKDYINRRGLEYIADLFGVQSITVELIGGDDEARRYQWLATVVRKDGGKFTGAGDADAKNVSRNLTGATFRIAETRAVNRAITKAYAKHLGKLQIAPVSSEEMGESRPARRLGVQVTNRPAERVRKYQ